MKAMILAAGLGERMRPLSDHTPKPLLRAGGRPLIDYHLERLARAGCAEVVINISHLAEQLIDYCGEGTKWGLQIAYSREPAPLETAGGIQQALPLLGADPFLVVNGDIWCDFDFEQLLERSLDNGADNGALAWLVMVDNPPQHPLGDFVLQERGSVAFRPADAVGLTYAGIGLYTSAFFDHLAPGKMPLRPLLDRAIGANRLRGEYHAGQWFDIGTPERLALLDARLRAADQN
ncbi:MAG: N-acetylmuramate alpha-1-phosphate uridylyltransferase MurU [Pseudomonadota bacterium]